MAYVARNASLETCAILQHASLARHPACACRSSAPTAFTGYSFHVLEAAIVFANEILMCFVLPLHLGLHRVYHLCTTLIHQGAPPSLRRRMVLRNGYWMVCCNMVAAWPTMPVTWLPLPRPASHFHRTQRRHALLVVQAGTQATR
jgi:hypothetical protein